MKKLTIIGIISLFVFIGCQPAGKTNSTENKPGNTATGSAGKAKKFAFVTNNASDFWTIARKGTEKADNEFEDVTVEFKIPGEGTAADQKRVLDDLVSTNIDGIAVSPVDPANQTAHLNELAKKTLIITQDSDAPSSERAVYVGTNNVDAGKQAGKLIKEALPEGGKIMIFVGKADAQNAKERIQGIRETLEGSKVEIIDVRTDDTDHTRAKANAADTLVKYQDIAALIGIWSYNGPAIYNAVKEAGKTGKVKLICFDEEDETLAGVKDGAIYGTIVQQPYEFGYQAIKLLRELKNGNQSVIPAGKQIFVPTLEIKKDNVEEFQKKLKELRGK